MNFFGLGTPELILVLIVLLLFFGKDKLPELARSIGKSFRELRAGFDVSHEEKKETVAQKQAVEKKDPQTEQPS